MNIVLRVKKMTNVAIFGSNGAIGSEFVQQLLLNEEVEKIYAISRTPSKHNDKKVISLKCNITDEESLKNSAQIIKKDNKLDAIIFAAGILHFDSKMPEKSIRHISIGYMQKVFEINTIAPALVMKEFLPLLKNDKKTIFAAISARVGSISYNQLGGWYSYRASKSALNMLLKSASIEMKRKNKDSVIVGLHPGTVSSDLSKPFQSNVKPKNLFTPEYSVSKLIDVISNLEPNDSGKVFAYDGEIIEP